MHQTAPQDFLRIYALYEQLSKSAKSRYYEGIKGCCSRLLHGDLGFCMHILRNEQGVFRDSAVRIMKYNVQQLHVVFGKNHQ